MAEKTNLSETVPAVFCFYKQQKWLRVSLLKLSYFNNKVNYWGGLLAPYQRLNARKYLYNVEVGSTDSRGRRFIPVFMPVGVSYIIDS